MLPLPPPTLTYRVECVRQGPRAICGLSEWHSSLASALAAMLEHQQRRWAAVALVPQPRHERHDDLPLFGRT